MIRQALALFALVALVACGSGDDASSGDPAGPAGPAAGDPTKADDPAAAAEAAKLAEKPWEVISNKGETVLPNVFYAEPIVNEQIMPYAIDGHVMIDRLIYPTLGNPNLYTKSDADDQFLVVTRLEDEFAKSVTNDPSNGFAFFLVSRDARPNFTETTIGASSGPGTGVYRVYPNEMKQSPEPAELPDVLKKRHTVRFVFRQAAMAKVPPGLYDVRFEVRTNNVPSVYEYQYNAVRVFDTEPDDHSVINVTDTQVSVGDLYDSKTKDRLDEMVRYINGTNDPNVRNASFITFNGDLHNGGSPGSLLAETVATTYAKEAKAIVDELKWLPLPIFLTTGNHDGYVSIGQVPSAVSAIDTKTIADVVNAAPNKPWPDFQQSAFTDYLGKTAAADNLGGFHKDLFTGGITNDLSKEIPRSDRNYILYDGFQQWQKTYGPLYYSWRFGKTHYVSLNSYELRQHRRSGWGMYTVNYGGGISKRQMEWLDRELDRAHADQKDVVVLAHHDPRGGHKGKDLGYYFEQLDYRSIYESAINYLVGKVWNSAVCQLPPWALTRDQQDSCVHDGLQEWMRPDTEFDADWMSGVELIKRLTQSAEARTLLLGHTHYNALEVLQPGDTLMPEALPTNSVAAQQFATLEVQNPLRGSSTSHQLREYDPSAVDLLQIQKRYSAFTATYAQAMLDAPPQLAHELVVMRLVSNADLANQTYDDGKSAMGFAVLHRSQRIDKVTFFVNTGSATFLNLKTIDIDRSLRLAPHDANNPIQQLYKW